VRFGIGIGIGIVLVATGAMLLWRSDGEVAGVELATLGGTLLFAGAAGALLVIALWASAPLRRADAGDRETQPPDLR
jgi:hypothetical protein